MAYMTYPVYHIEWQVLNKQYREIFGSLIDDNGLPYTPKDIGLPAWDTIVQVYIGDKPAPKNEYVFIKRIKEALQKKYGVKVKDFRFAC